MYMESIKTGQTLPDEIKQMVDSILGTAVQEKMQQKQEEEQQKQMAQQQAQQGQQEEQQGQQNQQQYGNENQG